jgi:hypothetical protein
MMRMKLPNGKIVDLVGDDKAAHIVIIPGQKTKRFATLAESERAMWAEKYPNSFVITDGGRIIVQIAEDNPLKFSLSDDDQTWPGGFGSGAQTWELIDKDDPRISAADHERLDWILED